MKNGKLKYQVYVILAIVITVINLSPLVLATGKFHPKLLGAPYTLWLNFFSTCALVGLAYLVSRYLLRNIKDNE